MWKFLRWFFEEFLDKLGFNKIMLSITNRFQLSRAAAFNALLEFIIATIILVYSILVGLRNWSNDIPDAIDKLLLSALLCMVFVVTEKFWK